MAAAMNAESRENAILWEFHPGEEVGPVIRVVLRDRASVLRLRNVFQRVGDLGFPADVASQPAMRLDGISGLLLRRAEQPSKKTLSGAHGHFVWEATKEQWFLNAAMLEPFRRGETGHQYLTEEGTDDALVEVSFGEA